MNENYTFSYEEMIDFMKSTPANLFFKDTEGRYQFVSEMCDMLNGGAEHSILGKTDREVQVCKEAGERYYREDLEIVATGKGSCYIDAIETPEGTRYFDIRRSPVMQDGKVTGIAGMVEEVTKRVRMEKELEELSFRDALTGLRNRNYAEVRHEEIVRNIRYPFTLIMADCNYLKKVNDLYGHDYGDLYIKRVARILRENLTGPDLVIRMGGDEFLLACSECSAAEAEHLIAKLKKALHAVSDDRLPMDVAFGFHTTEKAPFQFYSAYHLADQNMYQNKELDHMRLDQNTET